MKVILSGVGPNEIRGNRYSQGLPPSDFVLGGTLPQQFFAETLPIKPSDHLKSDGASPVPHDRQGFLR